VAATVPALCETRSGPGGKQRESPSLTPTSLETTPSLDQWEQAMQMQLRKFTSTNAVQFRACSPSSRGNNARNFEQSHCASKTAEGLGERRLCLPQRLWSSADRRSANKIRELLDGLSCKSPISIAGGGKRF